MKRSTHILLISAAIIVSRGIAEGRAENKPSIASEFLSVLAKNVATVLSPTLVGELRDGRPNRTIANATIVTPTSEAPKKPETTTETTRAGSGLEADTVRSAQTRAEVRPGNAGVNGAGGGGGGGPGAFPFNIDDNYRYDYPGVVGVQGGPPGLGSARPDYPFGSPYLNPGYYNADFNRAGYGDPRLERGPEVESPRVERLPGLSPVEPIGRTNSERFPESLDPAGPAFDRFRNLERFPSFRNQFGSDDGTNFPNVLPYRFGGAGAGTGGGGGGRQSPLIDPFASNQALGNFPLNFRSPAGPNNFPRNNFQFGDSPQQQQQQPQQRQPQGFGPNNFDFGGSQRFQNPYDSYPRSLQRGPNFPGFYTNPYTAAVLRDQPRNSGYEAAAAAAATKRGAEEASSSEPRAKSEIFKNDRATNSSLVGTIGNGRPEILSVQGRIRFGRLLLPTLDDYDDLRFRPDDFREYLFTANNATTDASSNATSGNATVANDV